MHQRSCQCGRDPRGALSLPAVSAPPSTTAFDCAFKILMILIEQFGYIIVHDEQEGCVT